MSSGCYFPPPVLSVEIPKDDGKVRVLGIPTVADRVAQMVAKLTLEPFVEPIFHVDSYGYRPGKSAGDAIGKARERCMRLDWVIDLDIKGFFDNLDHDLVMKSVKVHTDLKWIHLYIERWLKAPMQMADGTLKERKTGSPQGGVISPLLANLFMHYAFDEWMAQNIKVPFERYADDVVIHCGSLAQAKFVLEAVRRRLREWKLELHPEKTKIVYCKDGHRQGTFEPKSFDFLSYTFRARSVKTDTGKLFVGFLPAISEKAAKRIREEIRSWELPIKWNTSTLKDLASWINPFVRGWVNYYGQYYRSKMMHLLGYLNLTLGRWAKRKYKRFHREWKAAFRWLGRLARRNPDLFAQWKLGVVPTTGR
jgi:RNA-directed DNA polymerase